VLSLDKAVGIDDLKDFIDSDVADKMPDYYKYVAKFISKIANDPNCMSDDDFEELMDEGFSREEICEIIAVVDLASMFNVYTSSLKLDLDPEYEAII
jgi:alkylhydroperoxidase family enzyme